MNAQLLIDKRLSHDSFFVKNLSLSSVFLKKDPEIPWILLIPLRPEITELYQLSQSDQSTLMNEISVVSKLIKNIYAPDKINIGALGNIVPQLHVHIIGRYKNDRAWPNAVWGTTSNKDWEGSFVQSRYQKLLDIM